MQAPFRFGSVVTIWLAVVVALPLWVSNSARTPEISSCPRLRLDAEFASIPRPNVREVMARLGFSLADSDSIGLL
jgi:hypothetical protein